MVALFEESGDGSCAILQPTREIDDRVCEALIERIAQVPSGGTVVLDLSVSGFNDSIFKVVKKVRADGLSGRFAIATGAGPLIRLFETTGFGKLILCAEDVEAAKRALNNGER